MKIPEKLKIGGRIYTIIRPDMVSLGPNYAGCIEYKKGTIEIQADMEETQACNTLMHEVMHGVYDFCGYGNHDEGEIQRIASALQMFIEDNPCIFKA